MFAKRLRQQIKLHFGTIKNFADYVNTTPQLTNQYLEGKRKPGYEFLLKCVKANMSIDYLFTGKIDRSYENLSNQLIELRKLIEADKEYQRNLDKLLNKWRVK